MSPKKLLLLTAVVAALFAFIVLFERKMPSTSEQQRKGDLYWDLPQERVTRLTLTRGDEILEFERAEGSPWRMVKPAAYPADALAVNGVVTELAELKRAGGDTADAKLSDYGLEKPAARASLVWTEADSPKAAKTRTLDFGLEVPGTDIASARVEGEEKVLFIPSAVVTSVRKPVDDFRSKEVFGGSSSDVTRLEVLRGRGKLVLSRKEGAWWLSEPFADLADSTEADRLVNQLTSLRVGEFVHGSDDLGALSLNPPLYHVTVTGEKGAVTSLDFGATRSDGNSIYALRNGQVLTVDREIVDELSKEAEPFRSTLLVAFDRGEATAVEGRFGETRRALAREKDGWVSAGHPVLAPAVDDLLSALLALKSKAFLDAAEAANLEKPVAEITVRRKDGPPWTLSFSPHAGTMAAKVSGRPGGFVLDRDAVDKLSTAFEKALAPPPTASPTGVPKKS